MSRSRRRARLARTVTVLALLAIVAGLVDYGWRAIFGKTSVTDSCEVIGQSTGTVYSMDPDQLLNASIIADVAMQRGLPQRATLVALATAQQESKLRNLDYGDADSIGLFQQRPSQGWGTKAQISDARYAAGRFFDALVKVHDWQSLSVAQAAQAVQHSAFPDAYGSWEPRATALSAALTGATSGQLSCRLAKPGLPVTAVPSATAGVSAQAAAATSGSADPRAALERAVAAVTGALRTDLSITSPATGAPASRTQLVTISGLNSTGPGDDPKRRAATVAAWAIAHAAADGISSVVVGDQEWRAGHFGWQHAKQPVPADSVALTVSVRG